MGQTIGALGNKTTFEKDPQDFSDSEWAARFLGKGLQGFGQGFQNYQNQNQALRQGGGTGVGPMAQAQPVSSDYFLPQQQRRNPNNLNFYGGY